MKFSLIIPAAAALLLMAAPSFSLADDQPQTPAPIKMTARQTPLTVQFDGMDAIGSKLSASLKEIFGSNNLFTNDAGPDAPKFIVMLSTVSEFTGRPGVGSAYAVTWVFSQKDSALKLYLDGQVGVLTADQIPDLAARLAEKTDTLVERYRYMLPKKEQ